MTLKNVLLINGISSGITGCLLVAMPAFFANLFAVSNTTPFSEVGIFLVLFALFVLIAAFRNPVQKSWARLITGLDITWVIASVVLVAIVFSSISVIGSVLIVGVAAWVGLMAFLQGKTLRNA
ncbi:hypothetical protein SAMN05444266_105487 [Chitinophaga jiangningensis]|uniref:SPW repeat-containing protein n=2 Tax=Chitinophaga jiangningensis TaxID=1419482 RepID=A0A1M7EKR3_9BACT|nr:hypothetical protein SAMN05444266_105487 [Chitinophaga jiangningensis]